MLLWSSKCFSQALIQCTNAFIYYQRVNQDSIYYSFSDSKIAYYNDFKSDMVAN